MTVADRSTASPLRAWVLLDYWNCWNSLQRSIHRHGDNQWEIAWDRLPKWLAGESARLLGVDNLQLAGQSVFSAYRPGQTKHLHFIHSTLGDKYGYETTIFEQKRRHPPKCRNCNAEFKRCEQCGESQWGWQEKGVDTAIAFRMATLAISRDADVIVLGSGDGDFSPVVEAARELSLRVVQAAFPPQGKALGAKCDAVIDMRSGRRHIQFQKRSGRGRSAR